MLAEFPSVVDAVRCAAEVQRAMIDREAAMSEDRRIRFRVGINLGDIIADEGDIFGDGVNVAARLEALSDPGGLCISRMVRDQIRDKLPYAFEDLGEQSVKNITRPVRVYALRPEAVAAPRASRRPIGSPRRRRGAIAAMVGIASVALVIAVVAWWGWPQRDLLPRRPPRSRQPPRQSRSQRPRRVCQSSCCRSPISATTPISSISRTASLKI
jgi:adenylate cyclase